MCMQITRANDTLLNTSRVFIPCKRCYSVQDQYAAEKEFLAEGSVTYILFVIVADNRDLNQTAEEAQPVLD